MDGPDMWLEDIHLTPEPTEFVRVWLHTWVPTAPPVVATETSDPDGTVVHNITTL